MFVLRETAVTVLTLFAVASIGYLVGSVRVRNVGLGTAAIFLVGLVFGHFGAELPGSLQTIGVALFLGMTGLTVGETFFGNLRRNGPAYALIAVATVATGVAVCAALSRLAGVAMPVVMGMMSGAYTSSPGFAAAKEAVAAGGGAVAQVAAGYGVAYPFGTLGKVLFVQVVPKLLHADMDRERSRITPPPPAASRAGRPLRRLDALGLFPLALTIVLGELLGAVSIPLPGGGAFSLGSAGGPLIAALLLGHLGHIGPVSLQAAPGTAGPVKELGLILFFASAGVEGGRGMAPVLAEYGPSLLLFTLLLLFIPLLTGFLLSFRLLRLPLLNSLAAMTGGMTCSASLAALIQTAGTDDVTASYATAYPIALVGMVLAMQVLSHL